jgi:hypothetical protein
MSQSDTSEVKSSNGEGDELILTVPELMSIKGDETETNQLKEHKGLKRVHRYESTPFVKNIKDDICTSEEDYDVNKYKADKLKSELEELNRKLLYERIEKEEMRKKMSRDRDELI